MECVVLHKTLSHVAIAQCVVNHVLREEQEAAMRDWICGPQEFESGARERIKLAWERARAALKYVEELQGQAGQAARDLGLEVIKQNPECP